MNLDLSPGYSRALVALNLLVCAGSVFAIHVSQLDEWLVAAFAFAAVVSGLYQMSWLLGLQPNSIRRVQYLDDSWWLTFRDGKLTKGVLVGPVVVLPWMIGARFRVGGKLIDWLVTADTVSKTEHRRLRVAVRFVRCETQTAYWIQRLKDVTRVWVYPKPLAKESPWKKSP